MRYWPMLLLCSLSLTLAAVDVPKWDRWEIAITNTTAYTNKFRDVDLEATFIAPSGREIPFWGFFDGDGSGGPDHLDVVNNWQADTGGEISGTIWKLRFMPDEVGPWTYTWSFSDGNKSGSGSFTCVSNGARPGVLNVDWGGNVRYLRNDAGPFFAKPTGIWTFIGPTYDIDDADVLYDKYIDKGFNMLMQQGVLPVWPRVWFGSVNANNAPNDPHITIWYQKKNHDNVSDGPSNSYADATYDTDRMNLFTWKRLDQHFSYLADRGIYFIPWQGFNVKRTWPIKPHQFPREKFDWYTRYALARIAPYYNLTWNSTWESSNGAKWLKENLQTKKYDPWRRVFYQIQYDLDTSLPDDFYDIRETDKKWNEVPVGGDRPYWVLEDNRYNTPGLWWLEDEKHEDILQVTWKFLLNTSVAMPVEWRAPGGEAAIAWSKHLTHQGMDYIATAFNYVESNFEWWHPDVLGHNELVSQGKSKTFCLARPGQEYLIYRQGGGSFTLDLSAWSGTFDVVRLNPYTGATKSGGQAIGGSAITLEAPGNDLILHLKGQGTGGDTTPPTTPTNLGITTTTDTTIGMNWTAATDNVAVIGYGIRLEQNGQTIVLSTTPSTFFTASNLTPDTDYTFTVVAFDAASNRSTPAGPATGRTDLGAGCNTDPVITDPASASPDVVDADTTQLAVDATDAEGDTLTYQWAATTQPAGSSPAIGTGRTPTVTFDMAGSYSFMVTIDDGRGGTVTDSIAVVVHQTASGITLNP